MKDDALIDVVAYAIDPDAFNEPQFQRLPPETAQHRARVKASRVLKAIAAYETADEGK